jgi:hypothetical protein
MAIVATGHRSRKSVVRAKRRAEDRGRKLKQTPNVQRRTPNEKGRRRTAVAVYDRRNAQRPTRSVQRSMAEDIRLREGECESVRKQAARQAEVRRQTRRRITSAQARQRSFRSAHRHAMYPTPDGGEARHKMARTESCSTFPIALGRDPSRR